MVSRIKCFLKVNKNITTHFLSLFIFECQLTVILVRAVWQECLALKPVGYQLISCYLARLVMFRILTLALPMYVINHNVHTRDNEKPKTTYVCNTEKMNKGHITSSHSPHVGRCTSCVVPLVS